MFICTEKYVYYNANSADKNTGDCVKRSLSLVFDMDYNKVASELRKMRRDMRASAWNIVPVFGVFIQNHGSKTKRIMMKEDVSVRDFADEHKSGRYLVLCGKNRKDHSHIVAIIDGDVYDSWDCRDWIVNSYWQVTEETTDMYDYKQDEEDILHFVKECIGSSVNKYMKVLDKVMDREGIDNYQVEPTVSKPNLASGYEVRCQCTLWFKYDVYQLSYGNNYIIKLNPNIRKEMLYKYIQDSINKQTAGFMREAATEFIGQLYDMKNTERSAMFSDEKKVLRKLPPWVRQYVKNFDIYNGNGFYKYVMSMTPIPGDPREETVNFYADTFSELASQIKYYKDDFSRYGYDY